jgi:hypothetical protein
MATTVNSTAMRFFMRVSPPFSSPARLSLLGDTQVWEQKTGELLAIDYARSNSLVRLGVLVDARVSGYYELSKFVALGLCGGAHERPTKLFARLTGRGRGSRT